MELEEKTLKNYLLMPKISGGVCTGGSTFTGINAIKSAVNGNYDGAALCAGAAVFFGYMAYSFFKEVREYSRNH